MLQSLQTILQCKCRLTIDQPVLVGVSGGPDSLCLLDCMHRLGYTLVVAHLDHCLRPESDEEARFVRAMAESRGLPFILHAANVAAFAEQQGLAIEETARWQRYQFLFRAAVEHNAQAVAVGHNADDQVETVLMHLLRGAGLDGLKGMLYRGLPNAWSNTIPVVRPLLGIWREQILAYLRDNSLQALEDASNLDTRFYRNRLRHELIPYLEDFNSGVRARLWRMADLLAEDHALLEAMLDNAWETCILEEGIGFIAFDHTVLCAQPLGLQRRLVRRAIAQLRPGLRDIDYAAVMRALAFVAAPASSGQIDLIAGLRLLREGERLWLAAWEADLPHQRWPGLPKDAVYLLEVPGELALTEGWVLRAELIEDLVNAREQAMQNDDPYQAWLDADKLLLPLGVRTRQPGDRIQALGMHGHSLKLADLMVNLKLPRRARDHWPLVISAEEMAWIPGLRQAHSSRVTASTKRIVRLLLKPPDN